MISGPGETAEGLAVRMCRRRKQDFKVVLARLLDSPHQLQRSGGMDPARAFIERHFDAAHPDGHFRPSALRRFLNGEFTGGALPMYVSHGRSRDIERILQVLDVIETMAMCSDAGLAFEGDDSEIPPPMRRLEPGQIHNAPKHEGAWEDAGRESAIARATEQFGAVRKKRGRPKGSKNKKRGRTKGSMNKPKPVEEPVSGA